MGNPYKAPEAESHRDIGIPLVVPALIAATMLIILSYQIYFHLIVGEVDIVEAFKIHSYNTYMLLTAFHWILILLCKMQMDEYLREHPVVAHRNDLEELKPVIRKNMYAGLTFIPIFLGSILASVMTIVPFKGAQSLTVLVIGFVALGVIRLVKPTEDKLKNIACTDPELSDELESLIHSWYHKALPNF